jgi:nucleoside-diphosphate-sugar epimerase
MTRPQARAVLITGCSSGIGLCVAEGLRSRGYRVFATARKEADAQRLNADGFESLKLDLSDPDSIADTLEEILERTGNRLYALFNNGGFGQPGAVEDLSTRVLRAQFEVNFFGWHELTRRVLPVMRAQGEGRIIQNSSVLGFITLKFRGAYNAALERRLANTESEPPFTLPPSAVLKKVVHAIESSRPRPRYYVTMPTHGFGLLKRLLPTRLLDRLLIAASGAEVRH